MSSNVNEKNLIQASNAFFFSSLGEKNFTVFESSDYSCDSKEPLTRQQEVGHLSDYNNDDYDENDGAVRRQKVFSASSRPVSSGSCKSEEIKHYKRMTEAFFIDPIRKFLRDGHFPFKLVTNCLIIVFLILIAVVFHAPESFAIEQQRKGMFYKFLGDNYLGKDKGNIKSQPTVYLHNYKDVLHDIKSFVMLYYDLSNTSVSELKYYYNLKTDGGTEALRKLLANTRSEEFDCIYKLLEDVVILPTNVKNDVFNYNCVTPVLLEFDAFFYSMREHWGPSPIRHFVGKLTEKDPLGPFKNDYCSYEKSEDGKNCDIVNNDTQENPILPLQHYTTFADNERRDVNTNDYVVTMCSPRYDIITGKYFAPCRRAQMNASNIYKADGKSAFQFLLIENVRELSLSASVRHVTNASLNDDAATSGFRSTIYHWTVKKTFLFHPGGLVEAVLDVSVITRHMYPYLHLRFFFVFGLLILVTFDIFLRCCALRHLWLYNKHVKKLNSLGLADKYLSSFFLKKGRNSAFNNAVSDTSCLANNANKSSTCLVSHEENEQPQTRTDLGGTKKSCVSKLGSMLPETTYADIYDVWREHMMRSKGKGWHYIALIADGLMVVYVQMTVAKIFGIFKTNLYMTFESILLGLGGFLYFLGLLSYVRYFPKTYFAVRAARHVIPRLLFFAMSVAPIYIGFAFFFCIVFGPHCNGEFTNMGYSLVVLYFIMFGDAILPAIKSAEGSTYPFIVILANIMTVLYVLFFMMIMLNLAMSIIQHEWNLLRRRFGACLSAENVLFRVRTRDQVKAEALEAIVANLELLLHIQYGDETVMNGSCEEHFVDKNESNDASSKVTSKVDGDSGNGHADNTGNLCGHCDEKIIDETSGSLALQRREVAGFCRGRIDEANVELPEKND